MHAAIAGTHVGLPLAISADHLTVAIVRYPARYRFLEAAAGWKSVPRPLIAAPGVRREVMTHLHRHYTR